MKTIKKILVLFSILAIGVMCLTGCENGLNNSSSSNKTNNTNSSSNSTNTNNTNSKKADENVDVETIDFVARAEKQFAEPQKGETIAIIHVKNFGDIKVRFFKDVAPKAVENFITHSKNGYYNGVIFHRVMNDFMIQGGDPTGTGYGGESIWKKSFEDEFSYDLVPYRGALCMANSGSNTNGSQFFIEQAKYDENTANQLSQYGYPDNILAAYKIYGGSMHLLGKHTVFGQVIDGMDVVDKIAAVETDSNNKPTNPVVIESIEITEY